MSYSSFLGSWRPASSVRMANMLDYKAKMEMSRERATMTAQFCASVTMMFNARAGAST